LAGLKKSLTVALSGKGHYLPSTAPSNSSHHDRLKSEKPKDEQTVGAGVEMSTCGLRCFKCQQSGHWPKSVKMPTRVAEGDTCTGDMRDEEVIEQISEPDDWMQTVTMLRFWTSLNCQPEDLQTW